MSDNIATAQQQEVAQDNATTSEITTKGLPKLPRVWEIDAMRGALILLVVLDHFFWDVLSFRSYYNSEFWNAVYQMAYNYRTGSGFLGVMRSELHNTFIMCFVLLSGISSSFSRCNSVRGVKMAIFALLLTVITNVVGNVMNISGMAINFNVIHVLAICILFFALLEWIYSKLKSRWSKNIFGWSVMLIVLFCFVIGYYYIGNPCSVTDSSHKIHMMFVEHTNVYVLSPGDSLTLFPAMGWFLLGAYLGKVLYPTRTTLFPNAYSVAFKPLTVCGSYSLWVYFGSQVVMYGIIYLFAVVLGVM